MARHRTFRAALAAGVAFLLLGVVASTETSAARRPISGLVVDRLGNGIEGVQILFVPTTIRASAVAEAWTGADGRFAADGLAPGQYRMAAIKDGYSTFIGSVNTLVRSSVDLVMHRLPPPESGLAVPEDASWTLRLPERSILREIETDGSPPDTKASRPETTTSMVNEVVRGRVEQLFAIPYAPGGAAGEDLQVAGMQTRMTLAAPITERALLSVRGSRETLGGFARSDDVRSARSAASSVKLGFSYDTGLDARLAVNAFYSQRDLDLAVEQDAAKTAFQQGQRSWGYDATWSKEIDALSRLSVKVDFADTLLDPPEPGGPSGLPTDAGTQELSNRRVGAQGSYEMLAGARHKVRVGLRAQRLDLPIPVVRSAGFAGIEEAPVSGWSVGLNAEDAWAINGPLTVIYGVAYHQSLDREAPSRVVPRVGAAWTGETLHLRLTMTYHARADGAVNGPGVGESLGIAPARPLGYDATVEAPVLGFLVRGSTSYEPVRYGHAGYELGEIDGVPRPLFVTDGNAATRQDALQVERQVGPTRAFVQFDRGTAEGTLAALPPSEAPVQVMSDRTLRFSTGRVGVDVAPTGTALVAEYRSVREGALPAQELYELRLAQDLLWLNGRGTYWRLVLAARKASGVTIEGPGRDPDEAMSGALALLNRQVSAGVAVAF